MALLLAALISVLLPCAPARADERADAELKATLLELAGELDGFREQKEWLARLPLRVEKLSDRLAARYDPPSTQHPFGLILVNESILIPSLRALDAMGLRGAAAKNLVAWFLLPTILHEAQHAIQVHEYKRRGALDVYFIESEVEAAAVEATAYLQMVERHPDVVREYVPLKAQQNETLTAWKGGFERFRADIIDAYARLNMIPTLDQADRYFRDAASNLQATIEELEAERTTTEAQDDRRTLEAYIASSRAALAELRGPAVPATIGYIAEQDGNARALWAAWAKSDPLRRLESEKDLPRRERARLAVRAATQLSILSPTANADEIERLLGVARAEAIAAKDGRLLWRSARMMREAEGRRVDYGIDVMRGRAAATEDAGMLEKILDKNLEHLRTRVQRAHFQALEREARRLLRARRG